MVDSRKQQQRQLAASSTLDALSLAVARVILH